MREDECGFPRTASRQLMNRGLLRYGRSAGEVRPRRKKEGRVRLWRAPLCPGEPVGQPRDPRAPPAPPPRNTNNAPGTFPGSSARRNKPTRSSRSGRMWPCLPLLVLHSSADRCSSEPPPAFAIARALLPTTQLSTQTARSFNPWHAAGPARKCCPGSIL